MREEAIVQLTMQDKKVYEVKVNLDISFEDVLVKLINETKIMEDKNANDNLFLVSKQLAFGPDKLKKSISSRVAKTSEDLIFKLKALIFDVTNKDYYKVKDYFINFGNIKTQNEQSISKKYELDNIKNFQPVKQQDNKEKINMIENIKMSEKIEIKSNEDGFNQKQHSMKINPNFNVGNGINEIKSNKEKEKKINQGKINLINENQQQPQKNVKVIFEFLSKDEIKVEVSSDITFNDLVEKFKTQALKKDKGCFKDIDKINFVYDNKLILTSSGDISLSKITKNVEDSITIQVINGGSKDCCWDVSDINNKNKTSDNENQNSSLSWWRILFFVVGIISLIAALVIFLVNPELLALIIPLTVFGGISLLVGFLWNTIKFCLFGQNPEEISTKPLTETNEYDSNEITASKKNLLLENNQNESEQTKPQ